MKEFDSYQPGMWMDSGMVTRFKRRPVQRQVLRKTPWKEMLIVPVLSLAVTVGSVSLSASVSEAIEMVKREVPREQASDVGENQVPSDYWPRLVDRLKNAPVLPESTAARPDPLF